MQFVHRTIAYLILLQVLFMYVAGMRCGWLPRIALLLLLQVGLGILTLLGAVPISLALGHQALAFMLAGAVTAWLAAAR